MKILTLLLITLSTTLTIAQKQEKLIIGSWFPLTVSDRGIGEGLTFDSEGKVVSSMGAFLAITYKMDGDSLIMIMQDAGEVRQKAVIHDTIMILSGRGSESKLIRVAGNAKDGVVGVWTGKHMTGAMQTLYFRASGDQYMIIEMQSQDDLYELSGDKLTINGIATENFSWSVNEDRLILTPTDNTEPRTFIRLK